MVLIKALSTKVSKCYNKQNPITNNYILNKKLQINLQNTNYNKYEIYINVNRVQIVS